MTLNSHERTRKAQHLFEIDRSEVAQRDRRNWGGTFDGMPADLQEWWRDRAAMPIDGDLVLALDWNEVKAAARSAA